MESDAVVDRGDRFELTSAQPELALPATLSGSLMARLDRIPEAREIAQIGSVIGREFTFDMLAAVAGKPEAEVRRGLARLIETDLLLQMGAAPHTLFRFKHALVQDAAYESLLLSRRRALHALVAEDLEKHHHEKAADRKSTRLNSS